MFDLEGHIRLVDFGLAKPGISASAKKGNRHTACGTPLYMAPEIARQLVPGVKRRETYGLEVDWYTLGVLVFELTGALAQRRAPAHLPPWPSPTAAC